MVRRSRHMDHRLSVIVEGGPPVLVSPGVW
nr:MAG TPA: hypothetical protein [Caudoviricetes sp.]